MVNREVEGGDSVLDESNTGPTELVAVVDMFPTRSRRLHARTIFGTDASKDEEKWMASGGCLHGKLENHKFPIFFVLEEQKLIHCAGEMQIFELESHCLPIEMNVHVANIF